MDVKRTGARQSPFMEQKTVSLSAYWRLLRTNRNYRRLWFAQIVSEIGDWLYTLSVYSLILEYTGSAQSVSMAFVCQVLPQVFASPAAGVLADRISRRSVMIVADWARAAIVTAMMLVRSADMVWLLYVLLTLETVFWAMFEPARSAVIPNITSEDERAAGNALGALTWSVNFMLGFAVGGVVAAVVGRQMVFVINGLSFALSGLIVRSIRFTEPHLEGTPPLRLKDLLDFKPVLEGFRYVKRDSRMLSTALVKCGLGLMGANWTLLPLLGEKVFPLRIAGADAKKAGMLGMSLLMACRGFGAILGPLIGGYIAGNNVKRLRWGILVGFLLAAAGYGLLGMATTLGWACAAVMVAHCGGSIIWVFSTTMLQEMTDDKFRGRIFASEFACSMVSMTAVNTLAGSLADHGTPILTIATWTGLIMLLPAAAWLYAQRHWRE